MPITDDQALNLYIQAATGETQAAVCSRQLTGFRAEFALRFEAWRIANAKGLRKGALLADAKGLNKISPPNLKSFATMNAQILENLPEDDLQRRCNELLSSFLQESLK